MAQTAPPNDDRVLLPRPTDDPRGRGRPWWSFWRYGRYGSRGPAQVIVIQDYQFRPATITVPPGGRVTWINRDAVSHTSTAPLPGTVTTQGAWEGLLQPGASYTMTFNLPGSFDYYCRLHRRMRGVVVVGER